jgi:hypothetical protein
MGKETPAEINRRVIYDHGLLVGLQPPVAAVRRDETSLHKLCLSFAACLFSEDMEDNEDMEDVL